MRTHERLEVVIVDVGLDGAFHLPQTGAASMAKRFNTSRTD